MKKIDAKSCRWLWREGEWRLMQGPTQVLATVRAGVGIWTAYNADDQPIGIGTHAPDARVQAEFELGIGHVMVSEHTTGG